MKKGSFFRRITGSLKMTDEDENDFDFSENQNAKNKAVTLQGDDIHHDDSLFIKDEEEEEGQLTLDLYQTQREIIIQTMVAGVEPQNLSIMITRDSVTIKGKREEMRGLNDENYFLRELYWGSFSRSISLPCEVEPEDAEATEKHGLLIIKIPKIDKDKKANLKVKSL